MYSEKFNINSRIAMRIGTVPPLVLTTVWPDMSDIPNRTEPGKPVKLSQISHFVLLCDL